MWSIKRLFGFKKKKELDKNTDNINSSRRQFLTKGLLGLAGLGGLALAAKVAKAGGIVFADNTNQTTKADTTPPGTISPYGGSSSPSGWLLCDGTTGKDSVADTSLADLFAIIGTTFGGTGASDFDLPDLRGRLPLGKDNMGGSSANRVTDSQADNIGQGSGDEAALMQHNHSHSHTVGLHATQGGSINTRGGGQPYPNI